MYNFTISLCLSVCILSACNHSSDKIVEVDKEKIGQQFILNNIVDSSGSTVNLDFSKSQINIIDFWNESCPPCIEEMKQFPALLQGKESQISIYSISVNQFWLWKQTLADGRFAFLKNDIPNWKQLDLMSDDNADLKNKFSGDRLAMLDSVYGVKSNPAYFVLDSTGKILSRPESAVEYLKNL